MEEFALDRTHREMSALLKASPKQATLVRPDGSQRLVPIEEVGVGDRVFVKPGELFPADGDVVKGKTASDESTLTGEAQPVGGRVHGVEQVIVVHARQRIDGIEPMREQRGDPLEPGTHVHCL